MSIAAAFDHALQEVDRAERRGLRTRDGVPADRQLAELRGKLERARDAALAESAIDVATIGALVRELVSWYPEDQVHLIAVLGALAKEGGAQT